MYKHIVKRCYAIGLNYVIVDLFLRIAFLNKVVVYAASSILYTMSKKGVQSFDHIQLANKIIYKKNEKY